MESKAGFFRGSYEKFNMFQEGLLYLSEFMLRQRVFASHVVDLFQVTCFMAGQPGPPSEVPP